MPRRSFMFLALACAFFAGAACRKHNPAVKELSVDSSAQALEQGAVFVDANTDDYRARNGKVPGAILLANYRRYEPAKALPPQKDTHLVFYCSSRL